MKAVIAGSSGLVGSELLKKLLSDSRFSHVIAITRKPLFIQNEKLQEVLIQDIGNLFQHTNELKGTHYFCCLGTTIKSAGSRANFRKIDYDAAHTFATIAKQYEAESFSLISASGANTSSSVFYSRIKGEIEAALIILQLKKLAIFRPGLLIGERTEFRMGEKIALTSLKLMHRLIPASIKKRFATDVNTLVRKILEETYKQSSGVKILEANDI
ncbi:MAG: oxidoreductase [Pseudomonadota bacterium]